MGSNTEVEIVTQVSQAEKKISAPKYPARGNRYNMFGWNHYQQDCYDQNDLALLKKIKSEHQSIKDKNTDDHHFDLVEEKALYDWWICQRPVSSGTMPGIDTESYTLPSREAKEAKQFPIWKYADSMARQIANWQAERINNQDIKLMNDPVSLVFDELRDWLFNELSSKECKKEVLDYISARQSYIKQLIHTIPEFGPDRLYLHELQHSLDDASRGITHCVANKELPQLLSELTVKSNDLETATATYLHFLLVNQVVADNFTPSHETRSFTHCKSSPVCQIYESIQDDESANKEKSELSGYVNLNRFYTVEKIENSPDKNEFELKLKTSLADNIKFASFVTQDTKNKYIESMALLESLTRIRVTLDKFQHIQSRVGTYTFAMNYLDQVDELSGNYINLVAKVESLMKGIIITADDGLNLILTKQGELHNNNLQFEKNLRSLETRVAKGITTNSLFEAYCKNSIDSMNKYQQEIKKLVRSVQSGDAVRELERDMQDLYVEMTHLNAVLPAILQDNKRVVIKKEPIKAITSFIIDTENVCIQSGPEQNCVDTTTACQPDEFSDNQMCSSSNMIDPAYDISKNPLVQHSGAESSRLTPPLLVPIKLLSDMVYQAKDWFSADHTQSEPPMSRDSTSLIASQLSNATQSSARQQMPVSTPKAIPAPEAPKMISATAAMTETIPTQPKQSIPEPTFESSLTLNEWAYVAQYVNHYARKYSPYTFFWNRELPLSEQQSEHLHDSKVLLANLKNTFHQQKTSLAGTSGIFTDQYDYVENTIHSLEKYMKKTLKDNYATRYYLDEFDTKLARVAEVIDSIDKENSEVKKLLAEGRRVAGDHKMSVITRNLFTNQLTLTSEDVEEASFSPYMSSSL